MLVKNWMNPKVTTVDVNDSMQFALNLIKTHGIKTLPVLKKGRLVGILTDRDLKRASASDATTLDVHELLYLITRIKVKDIMTTTPISIPEEFTMEEAAEVLLNNDISGAPVVNAKRAIIGLISQKDLFRALISLTGIGKRGIQVCCRVKDQPGIISSLTDIVREHKGRLASILSIVTPTDEPEELRRVYIRMYGIHRAELTEIVSKFKEKGQLIYVVDHRDNKRQIF